MSEIDKIKRYIERTPKTNIRYDAQTKELLALMNNLSDFEAIMIAFKYGQAKGYRAAKAEVQA